MDRQAARKPSGPSFSSKAGSRAWCVRGHRVRCEDITGQFDAGCAPEEIAGPDMYPDIPLDVVLRILAFAGRRSAGAS
jgi:uncharacterized protein (DUF433 family)